MGTGKTKGQAANTAVEAVINGFAACTIDPAKPELGAETWPMVLLEGSLAKLLELKATPPPELGQLLYNTEWFLSHRLGNPLLSHLIYLPSYNPGIIQGGKNVNVVADKCIIEVDTRVPFGMKTEFVLDVARDLVRTVAPGAVVEPMVPYSNPNWTLENRPIVRTVEMGIQRVLGMEEPIFSVLLIGSSSKIKSYPDRVKRALKEMDR